MSITLKARRHNHRAQRHNYHPRMLHFTAPAAEGLVIVPCPGSTNEYPALRKRTAVIKTVGTVLREWVGAAAAPRPAKVGFPVLILEGN